MAEVRNFFCRTFQVYYFQSDCFYMQYASIYIQRRFRKVYTLHLIPCYIRNILLIVNFHNFMTIFVDLHQS